MVWGLQCHAVMSRKERLRLRVWPLLWTRYHVRLADRAWRGKLARFMEKRLHGKVPEGAWGVRCVVRGAYPAEKHMGPNSAVKNHFDVVCSWWRGWRLWERESCRTAVRYVPASGEFLLRSEEWSTRELLEVKQRRKQAVSAMLDRIIAGCPLSEVESFSCPVCGAPMSVDFAPEREPVDFEMECEPVDFELEREGTRFLLSCSEDARHVHQEAITEHSLDWWTEASTPGGSRSPREPPR
ncbi:hypothetical protein [Hyalangium rubrum]|uniref:Uncharacterized protein n=1 Tax=Hyalangium rubrum TaxID=3103134 RepID=A0ABU5H0E6_9BACT|nr:hypothetical protein [Hyalangium sp. s54d21]MDY7225580.1 hypothetical protein [Hyalangium sp. s54d21]